MLRRPTRLVVIVCAFSACSSASTGGPSPPEGDGGAFDASDTGSLNDAAVADSGTSEGSPPPPVDAGPTSLQQHCVDTINAYRATLALPPYTRDPSQEACADGEAKKDGVSGQVHSAFPSCGESAQDECPNYGGSPNAAALDPCLAQMWAEGPGADFATHGHYINMSSTQYTRAFCGFYDTGNGSFWGVQDFY